MSWSESGGCLLLCATLTRLETQPCLSSNRSSVTSFHRLQSYLKGSGLPVSLPSRSTRTPHPTSEGTTSHTPTISRLHTHPHLCFCPELSHYQQQQTVAWLVGGFSADKAQTRPAWPYRHKISGGDKHWPPVSPSQLYICHMLMTSSPWPPTDCVILEGIRLRNKVLSPWNSSLILYLKS